MNKWLCVNCESSRFEVLTEDDVIYFRCAECEECLNAPDKFRVGTWEKFNLEGENEKSDSANH